MGPSRLCFIRQQGLPDRTVPPKPAVPAVCEFLPRQENDMLWTILVVLVILWLLGFLGGVGGNLIHILLVIALVVLVMNLMKGRSV